MGFGGDTYTPATELLNGTVCYPGFFYFGLNVCLYLSPNVNHQPYHVKDDPSGQECEAIPGNARNKAGRTCY